MRYHLYLRLIQNITIIQRYGKYVKALAIVFCNYLLFLVMKIYAQRHKYLLICAMVVHFNFSFFWLCQFLDKSIIIITIITQEWSPHPLYLSSKRRYVNLVLFRTKYMLGELLNLTATSASGVFHYFHSVQRDGEEKPASRPLLFSFWSIAEDPPFWQLMNPRWTYAAV